jgi:hypothetical protein
MHRIIFAKSLMSSIQWILAERIRPGSERGQSTKPVPRFCFLDRSHRERPTPRNLRVSHQRIPALSSMMNFS